MNRRGFIMNGMTGIGLAAAMPLPLHALSSNSPIKSKHVHDRGDFKLSIFSKNLQWLDYEGMAQTAAELGFDGVDLTVRPGGHVSPERVSEDLPKAVEAVRNAGLDVFSIVTSIENADDVNTEAILKTASELGIANYRLGWFHYESGIPIEENLQLIKEKIAKLEALHAQYNLHGAYQNHSGKYFGAAVWDLGGILREIRARWTGAQYDIYHASIEGANSWAYGFEVVAPFIKTINIKDYQWVKKNGKWATESVPLGMGAVDFNAYFSLLKNSGIRCPVSLHYEYPLGTADQGGRTLTMKKEKVLESMKKDLEFLKAKMAENELTD
jgi:L-ribulose-5-phosphate 3-epimerase